ncbi:MAG: hypothetical protein ACRDDH_14485 [Cetobacterium sp.]|uniref:hypothetical protein n=1 Tax=Cetobacterium sp. TaxID=2071632 RepID=UPI003EE70223
MERKRNTRRLMILVDERFEGVADIRDQIEKLRSNPDIIEPKLKPRRIQALLTDDELDFLEDLATTTDKSISEILRESMSAW